MRAQRLDAHHSSMKSRKYISLSFLLILSVTALGCSPKTQSSSGSAQGNQATNTSSSGKLREVQLDFGGHLSEGGMISAYYDDKDKLAYFEVYLAGERGKVTYHFENLDSDQISIQRTEYAYDKSISEGQVSIVSQKEEKFLLENGKQYKIEDGKKTEQTNKNYILLYNEAMRTIKEGKK